MSAFTGKTLWGVVSYKGNDDAKNDGPWRSNQDDGPGAHIPHEREGMVTGLVAGNKTGAMSLK